MHGVTMKIFMLYLSEGRGGETWKPSNELILFLLPPPHSWMRTLSLSLSFLAFAKVNAAPIISKVDCTCRCSISLTFLAAKRQFDSKSLSDRKRQEPICYCMKPLQVQKKEL